MGCVLRAFGRQFDVDAFMVKSKLSPCAIFRKGELVGSGLERKKCNGSGVNIDVSTASFASLKRQIRDAIKFLIENKTEIRKLAKAQGLDVPPELDFGIRKRDSFTQSDCFPSELVTLAGGLGISIRLSLYPIDDE
jgi:hypothetical protein